MSITLTYDGTLARVRIAAGTILNANPYFETNAASWTPTDGTIARSTVQAHSGVASLLLTPTGTGANPRAESEKVPVTAGASYRVSAWMRCAVTRNVEVQVLWYNTVGTLLDTNGTVVAATAAVWAYGEATRTAPVGATQATVAVRMTGTPPTGHLLYIDEAAIEPSPAVVERSTDQVTWSTVRGGAAVVPANGAISLDDYEFAADVVNYYRVTGQTPATITPTIGGVWLKSIARPFLNRQLTVVDYSDVERPARAGVFNVIGRSFPVAVSDVRGSRRWTLEVLTETLDEAADFDLVLASGDPMFIHVPADVDVPAGYVTIGDTTQRRTARRSARCVFELPCVEVAAPGPDVVGATVNWQTVLSAYATWQDVLDAHTTWEDLLELVGDPTDVVVP